MGHRSRVQAGSVPSEVVGEAVIGGGGATSTASASATVVVGGAGKGKGTGVFIPLH
jgi:hypothetical protein